MRVILETMNETAIEYGHQLGVTNPREFVIVQENTVEDVVLPKITGKLEAWRGGAYKTPVTGQKLLKKVPILFESA